MTSKAEREVGDRIRALLRERDYASAAHFARMAADSLGIELPPELRTGAQTPGGSGRSGGSPDTRPAGDPVASEPPSGVQGTSGTVSDGMASIFGANEQ